MKAYIVTETKNSVATEIRKDCYGNIYGIIPVNVRKSFVKDFKAVPKYKYIQGSFINVEGYKGKFNMFRNRFGEMWVCLNGERLVISPISVYGKSMPSVYITKEDALEAIDTKVGFSLAISYNYN